MRYHCTPTKMLIIKKTENDKCWQGWGKTGTLICAWCSCPENNLAVSPHTHRIKHRHSNCLLGIYPKELETDAQTNTCTCIFIALLFTMWVDAKSLQSCPALCNTMDCLLCLWESPGQNTGVICRVLLQGTFPTQSLNWHLLQLLHCRQTLYC